MPCVCVHVCLCVTVRACLRVCVCLIFSDPSYELKENLQEFRDLGSEGETGKERTRGGGVGIRGRGEERKGKGVR